MAPNLKNLGTSIKNDASGLVGNIAKAILVFPETSQEIDLKDPAHAVNYGKSLGMTDKAATGAVTKMKDAEIKKISKSTATTGKLTDALKHVGDSQADLSSALAHDVIVGRKFTVQFNPSSIQIIGRGGGRAPVSNYGSVGKDQAGTIEYKALDPYINVSFTVIFDASNIADAFMEERLTLGATTLVKNVATAAVGHEYTVRPYVEGFLAALRDEDHRTMIFQWGKLRYTGSLNTISGRYTMFNTAGNPIRAEVQIGMLMGGAAEDSMDGSSYLDYWKKRYTDILKKNATLNEQGDVMSMATGNIKNQYRNLINI